MHLQYPSEAIKQICFSPVTGSAIGRCTNLRRFCQNPTDHGTAGVNTILAHLRDELVGRRDGTTREGGRNLKTTWADTRQSDDFGFPKSRPHLVVVGYELGFLGPCSNACLDGHLKHSECLPPFISCSVTSRTGIFVFQAAMHIIQKLCYTRPAFLRHSWG